MFILTIMFICGGSTKCVPTDGVIINVITSEFVQGKYSIVKYI